jgi:hypothetical protein
MPCVPEGTTQDPDDVCHSAKLYRLSSIVTEVDFPDFTETLSNPRSWYFGELVFAGGVT